jgi:hypothetical protein
MTIYYFNVQQQKVAVFASGMHSLLGAASDISWLDEQALVMISDEVLDGWGLLRVARSVCKSSCRLSLQSLCRDVVSVCMCIEMLLSSVRRDSVSSLHVDRDALQHSVQRWVSSLHVNRDTLQLPCPESESACE